MIVLCLDGGRLLQQWLLDRSFCAWFQDLGEVREVVAHGRSVLVEIGLEDVDDGRNSRKDLSIFPLRKVVLF
jgi:hypothetical protein